MIKGHGNDVYRYKKKILADFSSNVYSDKVSKKLTKHLTSSMGLLINYPEPDAITLQEKIAIHHKLDKEQVLVTNGSTEAFYMLAHFFQGKQSTILIPSFAEYEDSCIMYNHKIRFITDPIKLEMIDPRPDIVWIGNPNNPDGRIIQKEEILNFCKNNPHIVLIIDEAYAELSFGFESCIPLVNDFENLIIIRSLTKTFSVPGIRLGYMVFNMSFYNKIAALRVPWSVNLLASEAGSYIMDNYELLQPDNKIITELSVGFQNKLGSLTGLNITNSKCNFFLCKIESGDALLLKNFLVEEYGLLIRDASNFRGLDKSHFRLSVQKTAYNNILIEGIKQWMARS